MSLSPCDCREFSPDRQLQQPEADERVIQVQTFHLISYLLQICCTGNDDRDKGRRELPETAWSWTLSRDLSTPRKRFLW